MPDLGARIRTLRQERHALAWGVPIEDSRSDSELVDAANAGDPAAFETLYERHRHWVVDLAFRFTRDREIALDVLQETFLYLLGKLPDLELRSRMRTLLYPVVRHLAIAAQSRARRARGVGEPDSAEAPATPVAADDRLRQLGVAVDDLPAGQREVLLLRFADDLSLADIAAAVGIPIGTVKSRLHNALATLRADDRTKKYFEP